MKHSFVSCPKMFHVKHFSLLLPPFSENSSCAVSSALYVSEGIVDISGITDPSGSMDASGISVMSGKMSPVSSAEGEVVTFGDGIRSSMPTVSVGAGVSAAFVGEGFTVAEEAGLSVTLEQAHPVHSSANSAASANAFIFMVLFPFIKIESDKQVRFKI